MSLTTLEKLKTYLGITTSTDNARLNAFIVQCTVIFNSYCKRTIEADDHTEYYNGNGHRALLLKHRPINSIASVYEDADGYWGQGSSPFDSTTLLVAATDYSYDSASGILYRHGGVWADAGTYSRENLVGQPIAGLGNIKITYNGGYTTVPADIEYAAHVFISMMRRSAGTGGTFQSESFDYYSYSLPSTDEDAKMIGTVRSILGRYREKVMF